MGEGRRLHYLGFPTLHVFSSFSKREEHNKTETGETDFSETINLSSRKQLNFHIRTC